MLNTKYGDLSKNAEYKNYKKCIKLDIKHTILMWGNK